MKEPILNNKLWLLINVAFLIITILIIHLIQTS